MASSPKDTSATRHAGHTRDRILASARRLFSSRGYDHVGTRDIAGDAGVDAALVMRYFGGKEQLFREAISGGFRVEEHLPDDLSRLGVFLVEQVLGNKRDADDFDALGALLHSASSPTTSALLAERFNEEFVKPLGKRLGGRDADVRSTLIASYIVGLATMRHAFGARALSGAPGKRAGAMAAEAIQACATPGARKTGAQS
jgi:AcrR family transcriptional regulator